MAWSYIPLLLLSSFLSPLSKADTFTFDFSSAAYFDKANSTGIWNTLNQRLQASIVANNNAAKPITFGDASDGAFADGPTQTGITVVSGVLISINTDVKDTFQFSSFNLSAGKSLRITGSKAATIKVFGNTTVAGTIDLRGNNGGGNDAGNNPSLGGSGAAGGGNGGVSGSQGGAASQPGIPGLGGGSPISDNGDPGANNGVAVGSDFGGGGGCNGSGGGAANDSEAGTFGTGGAAGTCGTARAVIAGNFETTLSAGGGGGGGGAYTGGIPVQGGGGGGGGGAILISSLGPISVTGTITAKGGDGGNNNTKVIDAGNHHCGGGGAGGGGGSIWLQSMGAINGAGSLLVPQGSGGDSTDPFCTGAYFGGHGGNGIIRTDTPAYGVVTPAAPTANNTADVLTGSAANHVIVSRAIDLSAGYFSVTDATETVGCGADGTLSVLYEGSQDGVVFDKSVPKAQLTEIASYPYIRIRVQIQSSGAGNNPPCLTGLTLTYDRSDLADLKLKGGMIFCGSIDSQSGGTSTPKDALGDLFFLILCMLAGLRIAKSVARQPV